MLVNTRKLLAFFFLLLGWNSLQAQDVWTLKQCIDSALAHNKTLHINRNLIRISEQKEKEAKANLIPKVELRADYKYFIELPTQLMPMNALNPQIPEGQFRDVRFGVPHNINAHVQLSLPIYNPQLYGAVANTNIAQDLAKLNYQKNEENVLYDITTLYYNAQILQHQLLFLQSNLHNAQQLQKNMELLREQALATGTDVNKVKLQAEQLITQKDIIHHKYLSVLYALKLNIGIPLEREISLVPEIEKQSSEENKSENSVDLKIMQTQNSLLESELNTLKKSQYLPSLHAIASYGTTGFGYDKKPDDFLKFYPIGFAGLQLTYPIFNATITQRKINQKKLEISNNKWQMEAIADKTKMEIENAKRQRLIAMQTIANTENQILLAQSIYDQTLLQQKQGKATLSDILSADYALRDAQQLYLTALIDFLKADLELKKQNGNIRTLKN